MEISARVVEKSVSPEGVELTTFKLRYPKFIHGEFMTHRVVSRNASSSRAIPTAKLLEEVRTDALRASFVWWGKNEPGMQANAELEGNELSWAKNAWANAAYRAADVAEYMLNLGVHKQLVNRLLEPFSHINVVASATDWSNFFGLRLDRAAQPEMRALAEAMWAATNEAEATRLVDGQWHLPFVEDDDLSAIMSGRMEALAIERALDANELPAFAIDVARNVSTARCARVSYESFETGKRSTVEEDLRLCERLVGAHPLHASPAEHQATPDRLVDVHGRKEWAAAHQWGNFHGWRQHRKMIGGEDRAPLPEGHAWKDGRERR